MEQIIITADEFWVIYDSNNDNLVEGLLHSLDEDLHPEFINRPSNIKVSTNKIVRPDGDVLYLHDLQVDSNGLATKV
jgi:hypothetical protein